LPLPIVLKTLISFGCEHGQSMVRHGQPAAWAEPHKQLSTSRTYIRVPMALTTVALH
jgi:hypothetical protein